MKKIILILICTAVLFCAAPIAAYAVEGDTLSDVEDYGDGGAGMPQAAVEVPYSEDDGGGAIVEPPEGAWADDGGGDVLTPDDESGAANSDGNTDFEDGDVLDDSGGDDWSDGGDDGDVSDVSDDSGAVADISGSQGGGYTPPQTYAPATSRPQAPAPVATFADEGVYDPPKRTQPPIITPTEPGDVPTPGELTDRDREISTPAVVGSVSDDKDGGGGGIAPTALAVSGGLLVILIVTGIILGRIAKRERIYRY